jgi:hypothetical protein
MRFGDSTDLGSNRAGSRKPNRPARTKLVTAGLVALGAAASAPLARAEGVAPVKPAPQDATATAGVSATAPPAATAQPSVVDALIGGKVAVALRYRYEYLDREDLARHARASTLRAALGYETRPLYGFSAFGQFEGVTNVGRADWRLPTSDATYKQNQGDNAERPIVPEAIGNEINQAYLKYANSWLLVKLGRQEIALNNSRFISVIPWRQSNQTFDAANLDVTPLPGLDLNYIFIDQVNRPVGAGVLDGQLNMRSHVGNLSYKRAGQVNVALFDLRLAYRDLPVIVSPQGAPVIVPATGEPQRVADGSTNTVGARVEGPFKLNDAWAIVYGADFARQTSIAGNPLEVAANYTNAELGLAFRGFGLRGQYSVRQGTDDPAKGEAFQTPLSHTWDGWVENFARTPKTGLKLIAAHLAGPVPAVAGLTVTLAYFEYFAERGQPDGAVASGDHYGRELDSGLEYRFAGLDKNWAVGGRLAYYAEDKLAPSKIPSGAANLRSAFYTTYAF